MAIVLALIAALAASDGQPADRFAGRTLAEALALLRQRGVPIVYSSAVVTSAMMVASEPRSSDPRRALDELLRPHRLEVKPGPRGMLLVVPSANRRAAPRTSPPPPKVRAESPETEDESANLTFDERIEVLARAEDDRALAVAEAILDGKEVQLRSTVLANDTLAAMHSVPRVAPISDFRSEFSVRGSGPRHLAVVIDGVPAAEMRHAAYGMAESAMLGMINPAVVDRAVLQVGAYPRRFADALAGEVGISVREGSRAAPRFSGSIGGVAASVVAEGPLRLAGSWLVALRQNFLDWPTTSFAAEYGGIGFGFRDVQAKTVYDVSASQRVSLTLVTGQSLADNSDHPGTGGFFQGSHDATLVTSAWRSIVGDRTIVQQRAHVLSHGWRNTDRDGITLAASRERTIGYRADVTRVWREVTLTTGGQLDHRLVADSYRVFETAAYADAAWTLTPSITLAPSVRVADASHVSNVAIDPSMSVEWRLRPKWTLTAATGVGHQLSPGHGRPERARYTDFSVERAIVEGVALQASVYHRAERDIVDSLHENRLLDGGARGVELALAVQSPRGITGSIAYAYGRSRYTDRTTGTSFDGDFDQPHALNTFIAYQLGLTTVSAAFRSGSNFPIVGYFNSRNDMLMAGDIRNAYRRPVYARVDVQASRTFPIAGREMTLVGEVLNLVNRTNFGPANGFISADGAALGYSETLMPRFVSAALRITF
jgi:hypothetical protein